MAAIVLTLHVRLRVLSAFNGHSALQLAKASTLGEARQIVRDCRDQFLSTEREKDEKADRLKSFTDVKGTDDEGRRLDQREFEGTKKSLRWIATIQMGQYRNHGGRYKADILPILTGDFKHYEVDPSHEFHLQVAADGQAWMAWRRTVTGWCFAIGAAGPPPDEWLYDGPDPPLGLPGEDDAWGQRWGIDARNW